jgi:hypothetical protein
MVWCIVAIVVAGCVDHPVGPARSYESFAAKASTTAASALSAVETVRLVAAAAADGRAFGPYTSVAVSEQEDTLSGVQGTFASIQPPDDRADELRDELTAVLSRALGNVADVRIEARRGNLGDLDEVAAPLAADADDLRAIVAELS